LPGHAASRKRAHAFYILTAVAVGQLKSTEDREISTAMAFVRVLNTLLRDKAIGKRIAPKD
jgi:pyruvate dehydrogenase E1 component